MTRPDDIPFDRLPRRVRFYIQKLERDLDDAYDTLRTLTDEDAPIQIERYLSDEPPIGIKEQATVSFRVNKWHSIEVSLDYNEKGKIRITTDGRLVVQPDAANTIHVYPDKF